LPQCANCVTPVLTLDSGVTAQSNPGSGTLSNPPNSCGGAPCPGVLATIRADYQYPPDEQFQLPAYNSFPVSVFGTSCYYSTSETQFGTPPDSCGQITIAWPGGPTVQYTGASAAPPGLPARQYCNAFLADLRLQGSGNLVDGTPVQYDPGSGYSVVSYIRGANGPMIPNQTLARDPSMVPTNTYLSLNGASSTSSDGTWQATDTGGAISGFRLDLYRGAGPTACAGANASNAVTVSSCSPRQFYCPASTDLH
jgi:3D (Asp-Asp-Asp) domain-containing protein